MQRCWHVATAGLEALGRRGVSLRRLCHMTVCLSVFSVRSCLTRPLFSPCRTPPTPHGEVQSVQGVQPLAVRDVRTGAAGQGIQSRLRTGGPSPGIRRPCLRDHQSFTLRTNTLPLASPARRAHNTGYLGLCAHRLFRFPCAPDQVSHHPPVSSLNADSRHGWVLREDYCADVKFRGTLRVRASRSYPGSLSPCPDARPRLPTSPQLDPQGVASVEIPARKERFTYTKPRTTAHNVIFGTLWVDQEGDMPVRNSETGDCCVMEWRSYKDQGKAYHTLTGRVSDASGKVHYTIHGSWDRGLVLLKGEVSSLPSPDEALAMRPDKGASTPRVLWRAIPQPDQNKQ